VALTCANIRRISGPFPTLKAIAENCGSFTHQIGEVRRQIDPSGEVNDSASPELGRLRTRAEIIPEPTVTDGIVSRIGTETKTNDEGTMRLYSTRGDTFQLSVVATGPGNSGGPVFNAAGKVIGLFTAGSTSRDGTRVTHAVRIKHGLALLSTQKTQ